MEIESILLKEEAVALRLRALYASAGYRQYKMSKFEEYDLYARNKDFLASDRIVTFTDVSGRLMALKPDVTLSIIKNTEPAPGETEKLYYNETVCRVPKGAPGFREINQVGAECVGACGVAEAAEVLTLACRSLGMISPACALDVSHFGLVQEALASAGLAGEAAAAAVTCLNEKNVHSLVSLCKENDVPASAAENLKLLATLYGAPEAVLPRLRQAFPGSPAVEELNNILSALPADLPAGILRIDFSVQGNIKYYNGVVFKGYVRGLPDSVLSGGQYDPLLRRMKKTGRGLGFAVYLDSLQQLPGEEAQPWKC